MKSIVLLVGFSFFFLIKIFKRIVSGGRAMTNLEGVHPFPLAVGGCPFWY